MTEGESSDHQSHVGWSHPGPDDDDRDEDHRSSRRPCDRSDSSSRKGVRQQTV